jgi:uncharacterized protein
MTKNLSESEAWAVIDHGKTGRLGCIDHEEPYVVPINYIVDQGQVYSHSLPGRKIQAMRAHPRACLQVDQSQSDFRWQSAIAFGDFEEVIDETQRRNILRQLLARFPELTPVESELCANGATSPVIVFRLRVDRVSGVAEE